MEVKFIIDWLLNHWGEIVGGGLLAGGSSGATKLVSVRNQNKRISEIDKKQDKRLSKIETELLAMEKQVAKLKTDIETNTRFDKQFREQMEKEYNHVKETMNDVKSRLDQIMNHLLNKA